VGSEALVDNDRIRQRSLLNPCFCWCLFLSSVRSRLSFVFFKKAAALQTLVRLIRGKLLSVAREASRAVGNLLSTASSHPIFVDENGLQALFLLARSSDNECQFNAAIIYRKLAPNLGTHSRWTARDFNNLNTHAIIKIYLLFTAFRTGTCTSNQLRCCLGVLNPSLFASQLSFFRVLWGYERPSIMNFPDPRKMRQVGLHPLLGLAQLRDARVQAVAAAALFYFASNQAFKVPH